MRITAVSAQLLRLAATKTTALPMAGSGGGSSSIDVLLARVETDAKLTGIGFIHAFAGSRSLLSAVDELQPLLVGEHALSHERLWAKVRSLDSPAAHRAYGAIDVALWDLKGKAANLPLWRLLGGARETAKVFTAETAGMPTANDVIGAARNALSQGMKGLRMSIRGVDPEAESQAIVTVRDALGEQIWFAIGVENSFDYETALPMARFLEEEVGADWFEDPLADDDLAGYTRLAARTDTPLATGSRYTTTGQFVRAIETGAPLTLRPDLMRLGGLTPLLKVATLAELHRRPLVPRLLPEIAVHLACGLPGVQAIEYVPWLTPLFRDPARITDGSFTPSNQPGLGLELNEESLRKLQVA